MKKSKNTSEKFSFEHFEVAKLKNQKLIYGGNPDTSPPLRDTMLPDTSPPVVDTMRNNILPDTARL